MFLQDLGHPIDSAATLLVGLGEGSSFWCYMCELWEEDVPSARAAWCDLPFILASTCCCELDRCCLGGAGDGSTQEKEMGAGSTAQLAFPFSRPAMGTSQMLGLLLM